MSKLLDNLREAEQKREALHNASAESADGEPTDNHVGEESPTANAGIAQAAALSALRASIAKDLQGAKRARTHADSESVKIVRAQERIEVEKRAIAVARMRVVMEGEAAKLADERRDVDAEAALQAQERAQIEAQALHAAQAPIAAQVQRRKAMTSAQAALRAVRRSRRVAAGERRFSLSYAAAALLVTAVGAGGYYVTHYAPAPVTVVQPSQPVSATSVAQPPVLQLDRDWSHAQAVAPVSSPAAGVTSAQAGLKPQ